MTIHPMAHVAFRPAVATLAAGVLAVLAGSACREAPPEAQVRTTTAVGSSTAPSAAQAADRDRALLRVVAAIPAASGLDLFVETEKFADQLEYRTITPYREVRSGRQRCGCGRRASIPPIRSPRTVRSSAPVGTTPRS